jgi:hypothetical protein
VSIFPAICKFTGFSYPMRGKSLSFYRGKITKKIKYRKKKRVKNKTLKLLPVEFRGILLAKQQNLLIS